MGQYDINHIKTILSEIHENDEAQLNVIFSDSTRMMVEAPAGYGKTTTMISRIAYLFATNKIVSPKKMLALTFSVNAALKIKRDVAAKLPVLLGMQNNPNYISEKTNITNYHGFCKSILKKYGYLLNNSLKNIDNLLAFGDEEICRNTGISILFSQEELATIDDVNNKIKSSINISNELTEKYTDIITKVLLPVGKITHTAIILYTLKLFNTYPKCLAFYQKYYSLIVIDEFQDTNIIAWKLVDKLITPKSNLLFMGDSLQRIYGFIGAYPDIMNKCVSRYNMELINLKKNYRFRNNIEMLKLDNNIRQNAINFNQPNIVEEAALPFMFYSTQKSEAETIALEISKLHAHCDDKISILVKNRGCNTNIIEDELKNKGINYFYGLFTDDDENYVNFHKTCLTLFLNTINKRTNVTIKALEVFSSSIEKQYKNSNTAIEKSLVALLHALIKKVSVDYIDLSSDDKKQFFLDVFENRQLKQAMEYINERIILSTVHGAKGLEWDYVFLADVESFIIPSFSACGSCDNKDLSTNYCCKLRTPISNDFKKLLIEELCVFYVAITRARKQIYVSASTERFNAAGRKFTNARASCFLFLQGIKPYKFPVKGS